MCGISGFVNFEGHDRHESSYRVKRMTDTLSHRGPDEEGYYVDDYAALGHRRLSIIDLSSGQQPMGVAGGQVQIVFNGEIYNFMEIRVELESKGHDFKTRSDTEVLLEAYLEWGEGCVERLNGMFAFAIWDARTKELLLGRDRVGKKPLYYYYDNRQTFAFASELKALRAGDFCPDKIDLEALDCYFSFGYIPTPRTIYTEVRKLNAGHTLLVSEKSMVKRRYWWLSFANPVDRQFEDAVDEFESLLDDAVKCRLMSEVPLGVFLSGGIDSPLVVSSMARLMDKAVVTNSIGFDNKSFSELPVARQVAEHLKTDHHEFIVQPQITETLNKIAWHLDEPFADSSAVPTWYVCKMARQNVTVALSGDGGDESFGGYTFRYIPHILESKIRAALPVGVRKCVFGGLGAVWPGSACLPKPLRLKTIFENLAVTDGEAFYRDLVWLRSDIRKDLYSKDFLRELNGFTPMEAVWPLYAHSDAVDPLGRSQFTDIHLYMTDDVLVKVDRMSMAHSLEVRSPLLDHRLIEFAARLPAKLKLNSRTGKVLLRRLASRRLPAEIHKKPKRGFSIPSGQWLKRDLKAPAESMLFDGNSLISVFLRKEVVTKLWKEHQSGARDHSVFLWGLLMLSLWEQNSRKDASGSWSRAKGTFYPRDGAFQRSRGMREPRCLERGFSKAIHFSGLEPKCN
jgi:asparagine synthase (glutamine-hydrolysing)